MRHWTFEDVLNFDTWLKERGGNIIYPVSNTFNGQYIIPMNKPNGMTSQEAVDNYDRTVVNG